VIWSGENGLRPVRHAFYLGTHAACMQIVANGVFRAILSLWFEVRIPSYDLMKRRAGRLPF
jgi:hypothetical protein